MVFKTTRTRRAALLSSAAGLVLSGMIPAVAQDQDDDGDIGVEEVVVTGSRIARPNITSSSPVTVLEAEAFDVIGAVDTIDLINQLPQAFVAQDSSFANGANGTSTLNLRGLGAIRTLVLANGKRLPYGSPTQGGIPSDINLIPAQLVERVEIVTGGASAVYGSDAVAGVANFILKRDFEGMQLDILYGFNQHNNRSNESQRRLSDAGFSPVSGSTTDNDTIDVSGIIGTNMSDGRGNVTAYFRFLEAEGTQQGDRDFAQCALGEFGFDDPFCLGSNQGPFPTSFVINPVTTASGTQVPGGSFSLQQDGTVTPGLTNAFNFNPFNPVRRAIERVNAGFSGYYEIADNVEAYADFGYTRSNSPQIIAPSAAFGSSINQLNCDNPLLTAQALGVLCGTPDANGIFSRDVDGDGFVQSEIRRRFVEGGNRTDDRTLTNYRAVFGVRGQLDDNWDWDVFGQLGRTDLIRLQTNQVTSANLARALDIVADPTTGAPVCRSVVDGSDPSCIPFLTAFDPTANVDADALRQYVDTPTLTQGSISQFVVGGTIGGDLTDTGFVSPWAEDGAAILVGAEFRRDGLKTQADGTNQSGALVGSGGSVLPTNGRTEVFDLFAELQIPIIQNADFAKELTFTGAVRHSNYESFDILNNVEGGNFNTTTYAFGLSWAPTDDLRFRAQYQRAIRAPNIGELFLPQNTSLTSLTDPCAGFAGSASAPTRSAADCANTGVSAAQYGAIPPDSGQLNVAIGGNPNLSPEVSDTITLGVVYQPEQVPGLTISVDYYDITLESVVSSIPASFSLQRCLDTGDAQFCDLIMRGPDGSLTFTPREQANIAAFSQNIAESKVAGLDFQVSYNWDLNDYGNLNMSYVSTYQLDNGTTPLPGAGRYDCVGFFDQACGNPAFEYRHIVNASWRTPWDLTVAMNWRYFGSVNRISSIDTDTGAVTTFIDDGNADLVSSTLEQQSYVDLTAFYELTENVQLRVGIRNLFDNDPPLLPAFGPSPTANVEANTVAGVYEAGGRFIFMGVNFSF